MTAELARLFESLNDDEILRKARFDELTDEAHEVIKTEILSRGLIVPDRPVTVEPTEEPYLGDMVLLERGLEPTDAYILRNFLVESGILAETGSAEIVQANHFMAIAVGGASIRVPASQLIDAQEFMAAFRRGEFELGEDFEEPGPGSS
jgi:hypothetical protein